MRNETPLNWDGMERVVAKVGIPPDRLSRVRHRIENADAARPGSPYTLLVAEPGVSGPSALELLMAHWASPEAATQLSRKTEEALVLGAHPAEVRPRLGIWAKCEWPAYSRGHVIALHSPARPTLDLLARLKSLGYVDQFVLVSRLGMPVNEAEREIAHAMTSVAVTARVLLVGLPGQPLTAEELAEVSEFAVIKMRQAGFRNGRCLGAGVWFAGPTAGPPGVVHDVDQFLAMDEADVASVRNLVFRRDLTDLLDEALKRAEGVPQSPPPVDTPERERLIGELNTYLADLGRQLKRQIDAGRPMDDREVRDYVWDSMKGWGAYLSMEGHWMKYVETLWPKPQEALFAEAKRALDCVTHRPAKTVPRPSPRMEPAIVDRLLVEARRVGVGLGFALIGYFLLNLLFSYLATAPLVGSAVSCLAMLVCGVLGYDVGRGLFRTAQIPMSEGEEPETFAGVLGWDQFQQRIVAWFAQRTKPGTLTSVEEFHALIQELGIEEDMK
jgi:hypothetical protein